MNEVSRDRAPLDEVMLAMDVVDTLRHEERMIARELGAEDRDRRLKERLREIYSSQGIDVSDDVLEQGVRALREERFVYTPPEPGFDRTLATLYVTRDRWGKWAAGTVGGIAVLILGYQLLIRGPELRSIEALPANVQAAYESVVELAAAPAAVSDAETLAGAAEAALERRDYDAARVALADLRDLRERLERRYELRIVSEPGVLSGVERIPEANPDTRNYYLIVEAITPDGSTLTLPVRSEEDGEVEQVSRWGLRVDEAVYERVRADKQDDGIIQNAVVGVKQRGELEPDYRIETSGAAITDW